MRQKADFKAAGTLCENNQRSHPFSDLQGTIAALKRLQVDYVDLLFCHRPDPVTPIEETVGACVACLCVRM